MRKYHRHLIALLGIFALTACHASRHTVHPHRGPIVDAVYGIGTVTPDHSFQLKLATPATIHELFVHEGDRVAVNAPLVTFTDGRAFRSPIDGVVTSLPFKRGENIFAQTVIVSVVDLEHRYILVTLEQQGALRVQPKQSVRLSFESLRDAHFTGIVHAIYPNDGQFLVHIDAEQLPVEVLPGMTADVAIEVNNKSDALLIPAAAVSAGAITRVRDGRHERITPTIGSIDNEWVEIVHGDVTVDDEVLVP